MTWLQILAQAGVITSILSYAIATAAYFNGKHIKEATIKIDKRAEQRHKEVIVLLKEGFGGVMRKLK